MRHLCSVILSTLLLLSCASLGVTVTPLSSAEQKRRVFSVARGDYLDLRVDSNEDKKIEFWRVKKGPLTVDTYFHKNRTVYHIRKFEGALVQERVLVNLNGKILQALARTRKQVIHNYSPANPLCATNHKSEWQKFIQSTSELARLDLNTAAEKTLAENCFELADGSISEALLSSSREILAPPTEKPTTTNQFLSCLENPKTQDIFVEALGPEAGPTKFETVVINMKNAIIGFVQNDKKPTIFCKQTEEASPAPPMRTTEQGLIQVLAPKPPAKINAQDVKRQLFHEILHGTDIENEDLIEKITQKCVDGKVGPTVELAQSQLKSRAPPPMPKDVEVAAQQVSLASTQAIPATVAETPLAPTPTASPADMNRVAASSAGEAVYSLSSSQTSGIVRLAERVLSSTSAIAAQPTRSLAASSGISARSTLPRIQYAKSSTGRGGVGEPQAGEYIKEEVDLTKNSPTRTPASSPEKVQATAGVTNSASREIASTSAPTSGSQPVSFNDSDPSSTIAPQRGPKGNTQQRTAQTNLTKEEVVTFISRSSYQQARAKLKDIDFVSALKTNNITIFDLGGNSYGAPKGDIVFVDQGDRFVRQK